MQPVACNAQSCWPSVYCGQFDRNFGRRADEPSAEDATKIVWLGKTDETEEVLEPDLRIIDVRNCSSLLCLQLSL